MRSESRKHRFLATVPILSALLATVTSCGAGPTLSPEYLNRPPEAVSVFVTYDEGGKSAVMSNKWVILRGGKDSVQWISPDGVLSVDFGTANPFDGAPVFDDRRKVLKSPTARRVTAKTVVDYSASLKLPDGRVVKVDPKVEIWP